MLYLPAFTPVWYARIAHGPGSQTETAPGVRCVASVPRTGAVPGRRRPRAHVTYMTGAGDPSVGDVSVRVLPVVAAPMTGGADVLFPGASQHSVLAGDEYVGLLRDISASDPPEFGFISVDAWGVPCQIGTLAVIDDLELCVDDPEAAFVCSGIGRFRVVHISEDKKSAKVRVFHDDPIPDEDQDTVKELEDSIISSLKDIVRLSIKLAGVDDAPKRFALLQTMKRMESLAGIDGAPPEEHHIDLDERIPPQHWMLDMVEDRRRELLSFIILDLLDMSFMDRREVLMSTDTKERMQHAHHALQPYLKELAAKGAIISAFSSAGLDDDASAV